MKHIISDPEDPHGKHSMPVPTPRNPLDRYIAKGRIVYDTKIELPLLEVAVHFMQPQAEEIAQKVARTLSSADFGWFFSSTSLQRKSRRK